MQCILTSGPVATAGGESLPHKASGHIVGMHVGLMTYISIKASHDDPTRELLCTFTELTVCDDNGLSEKSKSKDSRYV